MNLATAKSTERAKEVGIRKTMGSLRGQLVVQFLFEAVLMTLLSTGFALLLLYVMIPPFNSISGKAMSIAELFHPLFVPLLLLFALVVGLLAGSYPSAVLSRFNPVSVLKGKLAGTKHGGLLRNGLVIFQFAISVVLIISTIVVFRQMQFIRNKELGFNKDQVISIQRAFSLDSQTEAFKEELLKLLGASVSNIVRLLSMDFLKLVGLALLIAAPVAWLAMNRWLESFAYRVGLSWWIFLLAGMLAIIIAFLTVSFQSIRAAMTDPVKSLRDE